MGLVEKVKGLFQKSKTDDKNNFKHYADCIVFDVFGNLLLMQRSYHDDFMPGKWCLPGGKIEVGEDPMTAAHRELKEETNLVVELASLEVIKKEGCEINYFIGELSTNQIIILDHEEHYRYKFVPLDELSGYELLLDLSSVLVGFNLEQYVVSDSDGYSEIKVPQAPLESVQKAFDREQISGDDYVLFLQVHKAVETIKKGHDDGLVSDEKLVEYLQKSRSLELKKCSGLGETYFEYGIFEKAETAKDPSHGGELIKVTRTTHTGKKTTKWVLPEEVDKEVEGAKKDGHNVDVKHKKLSDEELKIHAKNAPEAALKATIADSGDAKLRKIAHEELDRRSKKEAVQEPEGGNKK